MRKLVLELSLAQILSEKINKMLSLNNLRFIDVLSTVFRLGPSNFWIGAWFPFNVFQFNTSRCGEMSNSKKIWSFFNKKVFQITGCRWHYFISALSDTLDGKYARTLSFEKKDVRKMLKKGETASKRYSSKSFTSRNTKKYMEFQKIFNDQIRVFLGIFHHDHD